MGIPQELANEKLTLVQAMEYIILPHGSKPFSVLHNKLFCHIYNPRKLAPTLLYFRFYPSNLKWSPEHGCNGMRSILHMSKDQSRNCTRQWETALHCNDVALWMGAYFRLIPVCHWVAAIRWLYWLMSKGIMIIHSILLLANDMCLSSN